MSVQTHQIIEVDCSIDHLDSDVILPLIQHKEDYGEDEATLRTHIAFIRDECLAILKPRGVYKLFNPALCTLPPSYTEPGIKLVGTMAVLRGQSVYERMRKAKHCVLMGAALGSKADMEALHARLCCTKQDEMVLDACLRALIERTADMTNAAIVKDALDRELYTDDRLSPGEENFPLNANDQIMFYVQAEKRLGILLNEDGSLEPRWSVLGVVGMYDKSHKGRRRACGRCKYREFCSIRAIGMNCHGKKGTFA